MRLFAKSGASRCPTRSKQYAADSNTYPDWAQIDFSGTKTIDRVSVYTLQDAYTSPIEPTAVTTFSLYGLVDFRVEAWDARGEWFTVGSVSGNNLVKRTLRFAPVATDRIRVVVSNGAYGQARITEIEAWGN
jgi:hypothetical protein